jgi:hypothetical protein
LQFPSIIRSFDYFSFPNFSGLDPFPSFKFLLSVPYIRWCLQSRKFRYINPYNSLSASEVGLLTQNPFGGRKSQADVAHALLPPGPSFREQAELVSMEVWDRTLQPTLACSNSLLAAGSRENRAGRHPRFLSLRFLEAGKREG